MKTSQGTTTFETGKKGAGTKRIYSKTPRETSRINGKIKAAGQARRIRPTSDQYRSTGRYETSVGRNARPRGELHECAAHRRSPNSSSRSYGSPGASQRSGSMAWPRESRTVVRTRGGLGSRRRRADPQSSAELHPDGKKTDSAKILEKGKEQQKKKRKIVSQTSRKEKKRKKKGKKKKVEKKNNKPCKVRAGRRAT